MKGSTQDIHHDLIRSARQGDSAAQYQLYGLYAKAMLNVAFRIVQDRDEAEDVLQEAFVKVFNHLHQFRGESPFGAWVKRIVVNGALNALKKRKYETVELEEAQDTLDNYEEQESELSVEKIKKAVSQLPDGFRVVFTLYAVEGYDHKEIAEIMNVTESTSKSQYNRAKKKIQGLLKEMYDYER